jgi:hypothetical protein
MTDDCDLCDDLDQELRGLIRTLEHRRARSLPLDLAPVERIKARRAAHRRTHP